MRIALDAMGGDFGPVPNLAGSVLALAELPAIDSLLLVGRPDDIRAEMQRIGMSDHKIEIVPATEIVDMHDSAVSAIRRKKDSSIAVATDLVRDGRADAVVSAGHTGAAVDVEVAKAFLQRAVNEDLHRAAAAVRCVPCKRCATAAPRSITASA